jgi:DNA-binding NarL/FixJ family response regulator
MGKDIDGKRTEEETVPPRVMLVEDEFVISLALEAQLKAAGCDVLGTAHDAESAIEMACELRPDVVLMDIGLPGKDGVYATQEIMARAPTQIIMVTAYGDERVKRALEAGARAALVKPVVEQQLKQAIMDARSDPAGGSAGREPGES